MKSNTTKYLNSLYPYFKMLDNINNNLSEVIKSGPNNDPFKNEELFYNITSELLRLLPFRIENNKIELVKSGILLVSNKKSFIKEKYNKIINNECYYKTLKDILRIRNKFIHEPHNISYAFSVGGKTSCSMGIYYKKELLSISTISLSPIVYYLNNIFETIENDALKIIDQNDIYKEYPYYKTIKDFNYKNIYWNYTILPEYLIDNF